MERSMLKRIGAALVMLLSSLAILPMGASPVGAEINEFGESTWGVYESVLDGTLSDRIDSEVMAIEQIGNLVYVGGKFTEVRPWRGGTATARPFLAAFDATTGAYVSSFDPNLDGPVYALQASPDGTRLFVGGEFGDVDGVANTKALVALDPADGSVDPTWRSRIKRNGRAVVYSLDHDDTWLYVGGGFSSVGGSGGVPEVFAVRAAKLRLTDAFPDTDFTPVVSGGSVWGISVSPDRNSVFIGGYFTSVNVESNTQGFVKIDNNTGQSINPGRIDHNNQGRPYYQDVLSVNGLVFVAGMEHITWVLDADDLSVVTKHTTGRPENFGTGGDYQDLELVGDRVYAACHCRGSHYADGDLFNIIRGIDPPGSFSREDPIKFVAAYSATDGSYDPNFQLDISGSSGVWAIHGAPDGCLWLGGDLTRATIANGTDRALGGFSKHCDESLVVDTERPSTPNGVTTTVNDSDVSISWNPSTDNVGVTGYQVYRATDQAGPFSVIATTATTSFTDSGLDNGTYWYYLRATDAAGNLSWRTGLKPVVVTGPGGNDTERPSRVTNMVLSADSLDVTLTWTAATDNIGVTNYDVYRSTTENGGYTVIGQTADTTYLDSGLAEGTYWYYIRASDAAGNVGWRNGPRSISVIDGGVVDTERPTPPTGLMLAGKTDTTVDLTWTASTDNVGVTEYQIFDNATGEIVATTTSTSVTITGLDSGTSYGFYVRADDAAGNRSWRSNIRNVTTD